MLTCWIVLLALAACVAPRKEVAVVLGGRQDSLVEIFTDREDSCVTHQDLEIWSSLFKYSGAEQQAASVYVDNDGIYVCGGATDMEGPAPTYHTSCEYNHSPFTSSWAKINYTDNSQVGKLGGILDSAILPWQNHGFIQVGGEYPDSLVGYNNTYLHAGDDINPKISEDLGKTLDRARAGHCFVRVQSECGASCSGDLYIVLGGKEFSATNNIQSFISYVHCQDLPCQQFAWKEAAVGALAPLNLTNRDRHSCSVFREDNQDLVLVVDRNVTYILEHQCQLDTCTFSLRTMQNMSVWQESSKTTTLDGVPFLFTESSVYKFLDYDWLPAGELNYARTGPSIVSVPEDWLCTGQFSTRSSTASTSTSLATTDPSCPREGRCRAEDGRGEFWEAKYWSSAEKPCGGSMTGRAVWFCDGCQGTFSGPQPDRVECVETWVRDLDTQIEDPEVTSTDISANIVSNTNNQTGPGLTGGSILTLLGQYGRILDKRQGEDGQEGEEFVSNMLAATSDVVQLQVGWNEIPDESLRFHTSSSLLSFIDILGYQHVQEKRSRSSQCWQDQEVFTSDNIILNLRTGDRGDSSLCFDFADGGEGTPGRICIPESSVQDDCPTYVSSHFAFDNEKSSLFPSPAGVELGSSLIGLTVNNGSLSIESPQSDLIEITFVRAGRQAEEVRCVWWDPASLDWSDQGCQLSEAQTDLSATVCLCQHLTSFGIMFSGGAEAEDPVLSVLSDVLLVVSSLCVLATQALLYFVIKTDRRATARKLAENNRNWTLFAAQMSFVILARQHSAVSQGACQFFGIVIHFLYLSFFSWTVLEGYFFYRALVTVFDTSRLTSLMHCCLGYGGPLVLVLSLAITTAAGPELYLRKDEEGEVSACFLSSEAVWAMLVPAVLVALTNLAITTIAIYIAHRAGGRRNISSKSRIVSTLRNTVLLSLLLGVTWITAAIQTDTVSLYISVILNASQGVYILIYSVLANTQVRGEVRERMSGVVSSYISSSQAKVAGDSQSDVRTGRLFGQLRTRVGTGGQEGTSSKSQTEDESQRL